MDINWELAGPVPVASLTLRDALKAGILACDDANERGFSSFLLNVTAVTDELSMFEQYHLSKTVAGYCRGHDWLYRVAARPVLRIPGRQVSSPRTAFT